MKLNYLLLGMVFNILLKNIECYLPTYTKPCPLIVADECIELKKKLLNVGKNHSMISFFDYHMDTFSVKDLKKIYEHSIEIGMIQEFLHDKNHIRLINMQIRHFPEHQNRYTIEAQSFNIFRAFLNGNYRNVQRKMFTKKMRKEYEKRELYQKNKFLRGKIRDDDKDMYFFTQNVLYNGTMKRLDSYHDIWVDTSRHFLLLEDIEIKKNNVDYMESIENPIGIMSRGRSSNRHLIRIVKRFLKVREDIDLVVIFSFSKLQLSKRQIDRFLNALSPEEKRRLIICMEVKISSKISSNKIKKQLQFFQKISQRYHIQNGGYYFKLDMKIKKKF